MLVCDLTPGDVLTSKLPGDKKPTKRLVTDVIPRTGTTTFRTVGAGRDPRQGGEVYELRSGYSVTADCAPMKPRPAVPGLFDRARMTPQARLIFDLALNGAHLIVAA